MAKNSINTVLISLSDPAFANSLKDSFKQANFSTVIANGVRDTNFRLKNQAYSCVVLDLKQGEGSGVEVVTFMRTRKDIVNHGTPILLVADEISPELMQELGSKIQAVLMKPIDRDALLEKVTNLSR